MDWESLRDADGDEVQCQELVKMRINTDLKGTP